MTEYIIKSPTILFQFLNYKFVFFFHLYIYTSIRLYTSHYTIGTVIVIRRVDVCTLQLGTMVFICARVCVCVLAGACIGNTNEPYI